MMRKHLYEHLEEKPFQSGTRVMAKALRLTYFDMTGAG